MCHATHSSARQWVGESCCQESALNYRILMPHHGRSGSVKRATKPESESETETEAETDMETETETQKQKPKLKPTKKCHTCLPTILFTRMGACRTLKTLHKC